MTRRRQARTVATAIFAAVLLAGCAGPADLDGTAAEKFQARVAEAKQLAARQDFSAALAELGRLESDLDAAAGKGEVSPERHTRIESAISKVRVGLEAAAGPAPAPTTAAPEPPPAEGGPKEEEEDDKGEDDADKGEDDAGKGGNKGKRKDD